MFFDLLRIPKILAHLPSGIFANEFEFIQFALFNSPHLVKNCVFGEDFFLGESKEAIVEKILDILSKKQMTTFNGERTIIIRSERQVAAMELLNFVE